MTERNDRPRWSTLRVAAHAAAALGLAAVAPRVYAQARIVAVVDLQRAAAETNEGRNALAALKVQVDRAEARLAPQAKQLESMKKRLEAHRGPPTPQIQQLYQRYVAQAQQFEGARQQATQELQQQQQTAVQAILTKMTPVMRELAQSQGFQIIVDATAVHYVPTHLNLTDAAIELYNRRNPAALVVPDGGAPAGSLIGPDGGLGLGLGASQAATTIAPGASNLAGTTTASADGGVSASANTGAASAGASAQGSGGGLSPVFFRRDAGR
jgi:Skp family chaperone for outer membrane proteins